MANRLKTNPMVVDTTDTTIPGPLIITHMVWAATQASNKDIAADDDLTIKALTTQGDPGDIIFANRAEIPSTGGLPQPVTIFTGGKWSTNGLYIEDLDGGELTIWVD